MSLPQNAQENGSAIVNRIAAFAALAVICCAGAAAPAAPIAPYARPPAGLTTFYAGPTKVDLAGRPVIADIALHADMAAAQKGALKIALTTDVTTFVDQTEKDLKDYIAGRTSACGERWSSNEPEISFPADSIRFTMEIAVEFWQCGLDGKAKPARMTRDGGRIDVTLAHYCLRRQAAGPARRSQDRRHRRARQIYAARVSRPPRGRG
jgi:hypothetical protein